MLPDIVPPLSAGECHDVMIRISNPAGKLVSCISLISVLNRREELTVPSCPSESMTTFTASATPVVTPRIAAIKVLV